ncbi:hypothetical protein COT75_00275 [Candidatus Beckwithbacteria bacterium CG10_big_fil_rev_8_21_14_0_10_34_10]|uniref:Mannose-6-phosphate isomerase n=1 Tax=Candidatus Beckwithbacteria bacterium CG10_big_fil_rev_8_21_14_0_10_34_10 TaxID=1974495 RepID=A0A2H0WAN7_9BACT|nr:MAG: hypothetical protein COT75_00275 [Candidatus Beckwithbacteria bacterium CG10_big_fil_rev_8_21_14_0_10_34_10]
MKKSLKRIYLIVPRLIEQPTWGGNYIANFKGWGKGKSFSNFKIGQSYELTSNSNLHPNISDSNSSKFNPELVMAKNRKEFLYSGNKNELMNLNELIRVNPRLALGKNALEKHGQKVKILIKFTQAKGNSYQLHVRKKDENRKWLFKPESWYFFEPGLLTLGVKDLNKIKLFKNTCLNILKQMSYISDKIKKKEISLKDGRKKSEEVVKNYNPQQFVNLVKANKNDLIDLSLGGIHHSWEEPKAINPKGNIVYEVQLDIKDKQSTLRCFDQGKIKNDGSIRNLNIKEYFKYINKEEASNIPENHFLKPKTLFEKLENKGERLLNTNDYTMEKIYFKNKLSNNLNRTNNSYQHLFVQKGEVRVESENSHVILTQGHSCFIPAVVSKYNLVSNKSQSEVLKTYVSK